MLEANESPFDGTLGGWVGDPHEIKLKPDAEPHHARPFSVPHACEKTLRMIDLLQNTNFAQPFHLHF